MNSWDFLPQVFGDFPESIGQGYLTAIKRIESMDLGSMQLISLSQSVVNSSLSVPLSISLCVKKEGSKTSQELQDCFGNEDDNFGGIYLDTDTKLYVPFDFDFF